MAARNLEALKKQYNKYGVAMPQGPVGPGGGPRGGPAARARTMGGGKPKKTQNTIKRLLSYMGKYRALLVLAVFLVIFRSITHIAGAYMLRPIINNYIAVGKLEGFLYALILLLGIYLACISTEFFQRRLMLLVSRNAIEDIRNDLFCKVQKLPVKFYDSNSKGEIMSRFSNDVDNVGIMLDTSIMSVILGAVNIVGTLFMMIYTNVWLSLVTIAFVPVFIKGAGLIGKFSRKYYKDQQAALGAINGYIEETVTGQKVVKAFSHEEDCQAEFSLLNDDLRQKQMKAQFFGGIMGPVMGNISQVCYAVTTGVGGVLALLTGFDIGGLTVFATYSKQFSQPINEISMQMSTVFSALAGAERVFDVIDKEPEKENKKDAIKDVEIKGDVVFENVTFGYNPDKVVLRDLSLWANAGQKIAFVGSTGAGKTTITNLLNRFYDIDSGKITIDGVDLFDYDREFLRKNIAMVLQDTHLFTGTIMENIRYGRLDATDEEIMEAARVASAHSFIMRLSDGYNTVIHGDGSNLSQGQRQLLNIARASLSKAPILVLDEATSSVDTRTEKHIEAGMDRLMENRTTFVIAHRLSTVRNANAIMVLENGEIIERGTHDELVALGGRYYELYTGQKELD